MTRILLVTILTVTIEHAISQSHCGGVHNVDSSIVYYFGRHNPSEKEYENNENCKYTFKV